MPILKKSEITMFLDIDVTFSIIQNFVTENSYFYTHSFNLPCHFAWARHFLFSTWHFKVLNWPVNSWRIGKYQVSVSLEISCLSWLQNISNQWFGLKSMRYTLDQAKKYGYLVKLSTNKKKKLDIYKDNVKIASIGERERV